MNEKERRLLDADAARLLAMHEKRQDAPLLAEVDSLSKRGVLLPGVAGVASLALAALERWHEAADAARSALRQEPQWAWLHAALAAAEAGRGRTAEALAAQEQAVRLAPGDAGRLAALARYHRLAGQPREASRWARQAVMLDAGHAGALVELGQALAAAGDNAGALAQFRQAAAAAPADPAGPLHEGRLLLAEGGGPGAGGPAAAARAFAEALRRRPGLADAENDLVATLAPGPAARAVFRHLLSLGRIGLVGWVAIAFFYYVGFRLIEIIWKLIPAALPFGRGLLAVTLIYLLGGAAAGRLLRFALRYHPRPDRQQQHE